VALGAALLWGALSVLLSPCHLASIPLLMAFIGKQGQASRRRGFVTSLCFALGLLVTFGLAGALAAGLGRLLHDVGAGLNYAVAGLFFLVALHLWGVVPLPWSGPGQVGMKRRGLAAAFLLGLVFGIAIGPCTLVYLAPVLAAAFAVGQTALAFGIVLLVAYGVGHGAVIVAAGTSTGLVQRYLNWNEESRGAAIAKAACGVLAAAAGLYLLYTAG
jgi:cytochrome c-type biogenesis protein